MKSLDSRQVLQKTKDKKHNRTLYNAWAFVPQKVYGSLFSIGWSRGWLTNCAATDGVKPVTVNLQSDPLLLV